MHKLVRFPLALYFHTNCTAASMTQALSGLEIPSSSLTLTDKHSEWRVLLFNEGKPVTSTVGTFVVRGSSITSDLCKRLSKDEAALDFNNVQSPSPVFVSYLKMVPYCIQSPSFTKDIPVSDHLLLPMRIYFVGNST